MFNFLRTQYRLKKLNNDTLLPYVKAGKISPTEYEMITGLPYPAKPVPEEEIEE